MTTQSELQIKLDRVRGMLDRLTLDAVYLKRQDSFAWLTCGGMNYVGLGDMGNCGLLITKDAQYAITNTIEEPRMRDEEKVEEMGYKILAETWHENAFEGDVISKLVPGGKIGFDYGNPIGANVANEIKLLRFSLTDSEIERYKVAGCLTARLIEETIAETRPGDTEIMVVGRLARRIRENGMDIVSAMCAGDERINKYRHPVPTMNVIRERVQLGGNIRYKGLIVCCTRYMNFVPLTKRLADQYRANAEIDCTFMANSIPGRSYVSVLNAGKAAYVARGYGEEFEKHHQGGPIGYAARDYRVDFSTPGLIQENQAFCWNPSITGTKSEDTVIATSTGIISISQPILFPTMTIEIENQFFVRPCVLGV